MNDAHLQLAVEALARGNAHRAIEHLDQYSDPTDVEALTIRSAAFNMVDRPLDAERAAIAGLSIEPDHVELRLALSQSFEAQDRLADAEQILLSVLNENPEEPRLLFRYAWLLARAGDAAGARDVLNRMPEHSLAASQRFALLGFIAVAEGRTREARRNLEQARALQPESSEIRALMALESAISDRPGRFVEHGRSAAQLDPRQAGPVGREARYLGHPLMAPVRLVSRIGAGRLWIAWIVVLFGLPQIWPGAPMGLLIIAYLAFAAYTWIVPFLLRRWMVSRGQL